MYLMKMTFRKYAINKIVKVPIQTVEMTFVWRGIVVRPDEGRHRVRKFEKSSVVYDVTLIGRMGRDAAQIGQLSREATNRIARMIFMTNNGSPRQRRPRYDFPLITWVGLIRPTRGVAGIDFKDEGTKMFKDTGGLGAEPCTLRDLWRNK